LSKSKVFLSSLKMALATFCSRILGLVREQVMAAYFGASGLTDAFLVAYRIPNLLRDLFAEGAFSSAFVPTFVEVNQEDPEKAKKLFWALFILLGLLTLFLSALIIIFAPEIISLFAPTFVEDPEKFLLTVNLTKIMAPFLCFVSLAALFMGALNSLKVFFIPSLAPAFFNLAMISSMLLVPMILIPMGIPTIYSLGIGVFVGGLVQGFVQIPMLVKKGYGWIKPDKLFTKDSKKVFKLLGPGMIGFAATQINLIVNTVLASGTIVGAVSWLSYAFRMFQLPVGILSVSIGNSNLVHFSDAWKKGDKEEATKLLGGSFFLSVFLVLPPMIALIVFNEDLIRLIFERGQFDAYATTQTALALKWYAIGLPFYGIYKIFVPTFYAIDRQKIPVYCSIFSVGVNIIFCVQLTPIYGFEILAVGTTVSMFLNSFIQLVFIHKDLSLAWNHFFNLRLLKIVFAALVTFTFCFELNKVMPLGSSFLVDCVYTFLKLSFTVVCYGVLVFLLGERSVVLSILSKIKNRL